MNEMGYDARLIMKAQSRPANIVLWATLALAGCFYPPNAQPAKGHDEKTLALPYDLAWDATLEVVRHNNYKLQAQDPTHGIIEAQTSHFSLAEADCGTVGTVVGKSVAEPLSDA